MCVHACVHVCGVARLGIGVCKLFPCVVRHPQLQARVTELLEQLSKEKEAKEQQGGLLSQQLKSLQQMEEERKLTLNQRVHTLHCAVCVQDSHCVSLFVNHQEEFQAQLEEFDNSQQDMSAKMSALQREVSDLQTQLKEERSRHEADVDQLERESDTLKDSLVEKNSALVGRWRGGVPGGQVEGWVPGGQVEG